MEKLKRVYQKIFAGKSGNDETVAFGSTAQGSTVYTKELADIQTEAFEEGIKSSLVAGEAPIWEDNNSVFYEITSQLAYLFQQGISEWNSETTYFIGSFCTIIEGDNVKLYYSLTDNNIGNSPTIDNINWKAVDINIDSNGYANIDLTNLSEKGKELITDFTAPSQRNIDITLEASGSKYTAPANGYVFVNMSSNTENSWFMLYNETAHIGSGFNITPTSIDPNKIFVPVKRDDVVLYKYSDNQTLQEFKFIYLGGEE